MDVKQKYTADVDPKQITITYDFIDNMERDPKVMVEWEDIIYVMERICNDVKSDCSFGHVFTKNGEHIYMELFFELDEKAKECHYIVDYYEVIDSDRFLDLILQDRRVKLSTEALRSMV